MLCVPVYLSTDFCKGESSCECRTLSERQEHFEAASGAVVVVCVCVCQRESRINKVRE